MRITDRLLLIRICPVLAVASSACLAPILHTPHVNEGYHVALATTLSSGVVFDSAAPARKWLQVPFPSIAVRHSFGFRAPSDSGRPAFELGLQGGALNGLMVDAYLQAPQRWTGATDLGFGLAYSELRTSSGAYLQAGHRINKDAYIFTTQSVWNVGAFNGTPRRIWWQPTIAIQPHPPDERTAFVFLTMTLGPTAARCPVFLGCVAAGPGALVAIGVAAPFR